jgi:long-subunit acyl-CoA synthetase (AMP-forming)
MFIAMQNAPDFADHDLSSLRTGVMAGAVCPVEVMKRCINDMNMIEVSIAYGMTETSPVSCQTRSDDDLDRRTATIGRVHPHVEIKIVDPVTGETVERGETGEFCTRGYSVMLGYWDDPEKTAEAVDADGWMHTGDVVEVDADGFIRIIDRKKELIISAGGKNMSPANIEQRLKASSPLIGQACAIGDRRPYTVALLVLDPEGTSAWAAEHGRPDTSPAVLALDALLQQEVAAAVHEANDHLSRVEQIKRFLILPVDWLPGGDELTPTMKLRRKPIAERYAAEIEALYASGG